MRVNSARWPGWARVRGGSLNAYLQAIGGTARMVVSFADGHEATLDLGQLA
jgi:hypothetical protein